MRDQPSRRSVLDTVRRHPLRTSAAAVIVVAFAIWLTFGYFGAHLLFVDDRVDEASPFTLSAAIVGGDTASPSSTVPSSAVPIPTAPGAPPTAPSTTGGRVPLVTNRGTFVDRSHPTEGTTVIITDGAQTFLRLVDFETDNGPDLFVYLVAGVTATTEAGALDDDFVDLGRLKGNIGAQNYEVPPGTDLSRYRTVVVWCRRFNTAFGAADLSPV